MYDLTLEGDDFRHSIIKGATGWKVCRYYGGGKSERIHAPSFREAVKIGHQLLQCDPDNGRGVMIYALMGTDTGTELGTLAATIGKDGNVKPVREARRLLS